MPLTIKVNSAPATVEPSTTPFTTRVHLLQHGLKTIGRLGHTKKFIDSKFPAIPTQIPARWSPQSATETTTTDEDFKKFE